MSSIKSPQQLAGRVIKSFLSKKYPGREVRVISIMPCYDKKLEAVRPAENGFIEVDTVLATHEIIELSTINSEEEVVNFPDFQIYH